MDYRLARVPGNEPINTLEAHVVARAYAAAWRAFYLQDPVGSHVIPSLALAIDFGSHLDYPYRASLSSPESLM